MRASQRAERSNERAVEIRFMAHHESFGSGDEVVVGSEFFLRIAKARLPLYLPEFVGIDRYAGIGIPSVFGSVRRPTQRSGGKTDARLC